ncbi:MAG TPA: pitrilysin family protein [Candidatus Acidoferrales bacterium]|nr:pitrilysin family protein [Candidatus Acidoferrales bacterium]
MFAKSVLENGIRVLSEEIPGSRSVSLGIWVENGSRHEVASKNGISHFIEHLLFKGTERRSAARIAEEMDSVGGVLNAFTGKEYTCYYAKVLDENLPLAVDLLTDIFLHSIFDPEEIERERTVILQEISQVEDTPDDYVHELFNLDFFRDHALGRPICGQAATVLSFQRDDFINFWNDRYLPSRVIVAAAGHLRHQELVKQLGETLGKADIARFKGEDNDAAPDGRPSRQSGVFKHHKPLEQAHLCLGMDGVPQAHPQRYAVYVLNAILGGGMSSRLFQEIREKRGKVYSIYSFQSAYHDIGYLGVYAGTSVEWVAEVTELIVKEMRRIADGDLKEDEVERARNQLVGSLSLGLETSDAWMGHIAKNEIYFARPVSLDEIARGIRAVSRAEVVELANALFQPRSMALTILGDLEKKDLDIRL